MAKRFSHFQPNSFANKKPKLDISFGRKDNMGPPRVMERHISRPSGQAKISEHFFDDADDDVILLASQHVEAGHSRNHLSQTVLINESITDISFGKFACEVQTSTQVLNKPRDKVDPPKNVVNDAFDNIEKYFEDEIETSDEEGSEKQKSVEPPIISTNTNNLIEIRKNTKEREGLISQINYLTEKVAAYKEQIGKLTKDASEFNDKILTKDGEVSVVRSKLSQLQQQNEGLRLERMKEIDNIKKEWQEKICELEKMIKSQQNELDFKNVEITNLKCSRLNETQRGMEFHEAKKDFKNIAFLHNLHLDLGRKSLQTGYDIPLHLFERKSAMEGKLKFRDLIFKRELDKIQSGLSQLKILKRDHTVIHPFHVEVTASLKNTIKALLNYIQKMEFMKYTDTNASVEYKFLSEKFESEWNCEIHNIEMSVFQEEKLYQSEKAEIPRRLIGAFSLACKYFEQICKTLLNERLNNITLFEALVEIINLLGFSKELYSHLGLLQSLVQLLRNFIENGAHNEANRDLIGQYLRGVIFCRPGYQQLVQISECLLCICTKCEAWTILNSLCTESPAESFILNEYYKLFQFSPQSCTLQVYGSLLETAFPQYVSLSKSQIKCLLRVCHNHIIFLRNCFERNVKWVLNTANNAKDCNCYAKAVNSALILLHLVLKEWISDPKRMDNRKVATISRNGTLLLYDVFYKNYKRDVLQTGGSSVKHRLHLIHNWINEYKAVFQFNSAHTYALKSIMLSHIIVDPLHMNETLQKKSSQNEDSIWCEEFENFI